MAHPDREKQDARAGPGGSCRRLTAMGSGTDWNACTSDLRLPGRSVAVAEQRTDTTCSARATEALRNPPTRYQAHACGAQRNHHLPLSPDSWRTALCRGPMASPPVAAATAVLLQGRSSL